MTGKSKTARWLAAMAAAAVLAGCADDAAVDPSAGAGAGAGDPSGGIGGVSDITSVEYFNVVVGDRVFFETDRFDLGPEAQAVLARQAAWLNDNPATTAVIEGHADERGTREYNLGLGARRANSVRSFLVGNGVAPARLSTVSYGKERPVSLCSEERCWSQNRRSVSVVARGGAGS